MNQLYYFNPTAKKRFPGLSLITFDDHENPLENLKAFARANLSSELIARIESFTGSIVESIENNHPIDLRIGSIIDQAPAKHRLFLTALLQDIPIFLLRHRYGMLRQVFGTAPLDWFALLQRYWLEGIWNVDPDMPRVVARVIVARASQWHLMCRLYELLRESYGAFECGAPDESTDNENITRLGRIVSFISWLPYQWVEDILIDIVEKVTLSQRDRLRLWVSVLRSLFCRRIIEPDTVKTMLEKIMGEFEGRIPMDLQTPLHAVIVSSGSAILPFLHTILLRTRRIDLRRMLLETCATMDKSDTAWLLKSRPELIDTLDPGYRIHLLRLIGICDDWTIGKLSTIAENADERTYILILRFVEDFGCAEACGFLMAGLGKMDLHMQMRTHATIGRVADIPQMMEILPAARGLAPILYIRIVQMFHFRITESPSVLIALPEMSPLYHLERAREDIYKAYLLVCEFKRMLQNKKTDKQTVHRFITRGENTSLLLWLDELLRYAQLKAESYNDGVVNNKQRFSDYDGVLKEITSDIENINSWKLIDGIENTIVLTRETFLLKEWFVRPAPFTLSEEMSELVEKIDRGEKLTFSPEKFIDAAQEKEIRLTFEVFLECTKHGIYLTDSILESLCGEKHIPAQERSRLSEKVNEKLMSRRSQVSLGKQTFNPDDTLDRHIIFSTFAYIYRYGKESIERPSITSVWLKYLEAIESLTSSLESKKQWPSLPRHPDMQTIMGPRVTDMYARQIEEGRRFVAFVKNVQTQVSPGVEIRVIPNITYGLFCLSPILSELQDMGVQVSLAGLSSRFCDDVNISEFALRHGSLYPVKPHLFSTAGNYGTQHKDRILIVVDGTMEPLDRHYPRKIRLPKAHRGYINHLVAINYIRGKYGYRMQDPVRESASALGLSCRYVRNLIHTAGFKQLVEYLLLSFDSDELHAYQRERKSGKTYYSFGQWNPDGLPAVSGSRGEVIRTIPCAQPDTVTEPAMLFVSINGVRKEKSIPAYFDNNPEVERSRIILGPQGAWLDTGWPHIGRGVVVSFPEGENA